MPPLSLRIGKEEERTRTIIGKDVEALCAIPSPEPSTPWLFKGDGSIGEAGVPLAPPTASPQQTILLSQLGQGDETYLEDTPDVPKLAREAERSFANELLANGN